MYCFFVRDNLSLENHVMRFDRIYRWALIPAVAILLATVSVARAGTIYYWTDGSADWTTTADWSPSTAYPISGDTAYIGNSGTVAVSVTDACTNLYVGSDQSTGAGAGTLNIGGEFSRQHPGTSAPRATGEPSLRRQAPRPSRPSPLAALPADGPAARTTSTAERSPRARLLKAPTAPEHSTWAATGGCGSAETAPPPPRVVQLWPSAAAPSRRMARPAGFSTILCPWAAT